jgi:phosphate transport system ATP-binding protein
MTVPAFRSPARPARPAPVPESGDPVVPVAPALEARGFGFAYGSTPALQNISLEIRARSVTAIIGPSGCGKSTFLRSINRLNDLIPGARYQGDLRLDGASVLAAGTDLVALRQRIGMVFQRPNPFPRSIHDNVAYGPRLNRLVRPRDLAERVEECLRQAALWDEVKDRLDQPATSLSGGQQQRVCLARALANRPDVLLLDEPCSALDPIATQKIEELLFTLQREYTIVIVTHNMQQAARVSAMTAFLERGTLIEYAATETIFTRPAQQRTEAYITGRFG